MPMENNLSAILKQTHCIYSTGNNLIIYTRNISKMTCPFGAFSTFLTKHSRRSSAFLYWQRLPVQAESALGSFFITELSTLMVRLLQKRSDKDIRYDDVQNKIRMPTDSKHILFPKGTWKLFTVCLLKSCTSMGFQLPPKYPIQSNNDRGLLVLPEIGHNSCIYFLKGRDHRQEFSFRTCHERMPRQNPLLKFLSTEVIANSVT